MDKNWISVAKAAARMGVSEKEVMRLIDSYRLAGIEEEDGKWWVRDCGFGILDCGLEDGAAGDSATEDEGEDEDDSTDEDEGEGGCTVEDAVDAGDSTTEHEYEHEHEHDSSRWINGFEAAGRLGIGKVQVGNLALKGVVRRVRD